MTRAELEHIIRAVGTIADDDDIVVIGALEELLISRKAEVFPLHHRRIELPKEYVRWPMERAAL